MRARPIQQEWRTKLGKVVLKEREALRRYYMYKKAWKSDRCHKFLTYIDWLQQSNIELAPRERASPDKPRVFRQTIPMKHYIFRDRNNGGKIILATDAENSLEADKRFQYHFGNIPRSGITSEEMPCVCHTSGICVLPHSVGEKHLIKLAPDNKPKLNPNRIPAIRIVLPPHITHREFAHHCYYCGMDISLRKLRTKDHVTPKSRGGKLTIPCCNNCNQLKGNLKFEEYRCIVAYRNGLIPLEILQQIKFKGEELVDLTKDIEENS